MEGAREGEMVDWVARFLFREDASEVTCFDCLSVCNGNCVTDLVLSSDNRQPE